MFIRIISLVDKDYNQAYCFPYRGYGMTDEIKEKELEKLNQIVHKNPNVYVKLIGMLERGESKWVIKESGKTSEAHFQFIYPPRNPDFASFTQISESKIEKESLKEHIRSVEHKMLENCITYIKNNTQYECINPDSEKQKIKADNWNKYMKKYYHKNSTSILEYQKQNYQKKKDILNEKVDCGCGKAYTRQHQKRHEKTKRHQDWIS